ncbi:MAG: mannose-1-phosphate guanylyltransferase [Pirellulaceae bacterium]
MLHAMIMAGGFGTRFWPASRHTTPKQLLNLAGDQTMLQATLCRLGDLVPASRVLVLTNQRLVESIARQLPALPAASIIGEPCRRDTAPAIGLAAAIIARRDPEATMVVMPADHVIRPTALFQRAITQAVELVESDPLKIVTFGIRPSYPAESFGYIERGDLLPPSAGEATYNAPVYNVAHFREKPSGDVARQYVDAGRFYWNSGIFVWRSRTILEALRRYEPDMFTHLQTIADSIDSTHFDATLQSEFAAITGKSIDYSVMEHHDNIAVIEAPFEWDDLGSWRALARLHGSDAQGNTLVGGNLVVRTTNTIIRSTSDHLVAAIGVDNLIIVHTPDATLVVRQDDEEAVREIVKLIQDQGWDRYL